MAAEARPLEDTEPKEIVKLIEAEEDTGEDIIEELGEDDIREIYDKLTPEDRKRFRQFRRYHRQYFGVFGEHIPSYHVARQVIADLMPGLPAASAEAIAEKRAEILAEDRLRVLCKKHGYKFPEKEIRVQPQGEEQAEEATYRFPSIQDEYRAGLTTATREEIEELVGEPLEAELPPPEQTTRAPKRVVPDYRKNRARRRHQAQEIKDRNLRPAETAPLGRRGGRGANHNQSEERE